MATYFLSPDDLGEWVKRQENSDQAAKKIVSIVGGDKQQDILETCRQIDKGDDNAKVVLFEILGQYDITEKREAKMTDHIKKEGLKKEAQAVMRQDSLYSSMPRRICPKLPKQSAGKQLISTYNCRHYCLDSLVIDEEPDRIYCLEALWRRHVMDKFSREFKNKEGKWVGGYINERFQVFHDDGGNQMELANNERTREPRPHQWSVERRLDEQRGNKLESITLAESNIERLSKFASDDSNDLVDSSYKEDQQLVEQIFSDSIEMTADGLDGEEAISQLAEHYSCSIQKVASIYYAATKKLSAHSSSRTLYAYKNNDSMTKTSSRKKKVKIASGFGDANVFVPKASLMVHRPINVFCKEMGGQTTVNPETEVTVISNDADTVFQIAGGQDAGKTFILVNEQADMNGEVFELMESVAGEINEAADELLLNEPVDLVENQPVQQETQEVSVEQPVEVLASDDSFPISS